MAMIAEAVKHMLDAGMDRDAIVAAIAAMEEQQRAAGDRSAAAIRQARYRERKAAAAEATSVTKSVTNVTKRNVVTPLPPVPPSPDKEIPPPPLENNLFPLTPIQPPNPARAGSGAPIVPIDRQAFDDWNKLAAARGLVVAKTLNPARSARLKVRVEEAGGIEGWRNALRRVGQSAFLLGDNDRGWRADLDFMLQASSFTKLLEGGYDRTARAGPPLRGAALVAENLRQEMEDALNDDENGEDRSGHPQGIDRQAVEQLRLVGR